MIKQILLDFQKYEARWDEINFCTMSQLSLNILHPIHGASSNCLKLVLSTPRIPWMLSCGSTTLRHFLSNHNLYPTGSKSLTEKIRLNSISNSNVHGRKMTQKWNLTSKFQPAQNMHSMLTNILYYFNSLLLFFILYFGKCPIWTLK